MADEERARRIGLNEAVFRDINERIDELSRGFRVSTMQIVCECGHMGCAEQFEVEVATYERVRGDPELFLLLPGHEIPDVETVVESLDGANIVRKRPGVPGRVAERTDPRS